MTGDTDIANIHVLVSSIGRTVILVIMYVETFKTDIIVFIGNVIQLQQLIMFSIRVNLLMLMISLFEIKGKMSKLPTRPQS